MKILWHREVDLIVGDVHCARKQLRMPARKMTEHDPQTIDIGELLAKSSLLSP